MFVSLCSMLNFACLSGAAASDLSFASDPHVHSLSLNALLTLLMLHTKSGTVVGGLMKGQVAGELGEDWNLAKHIFLIYKYPTTVHVPK
ncbi:hypothetical protein PM082_008967 [Marasmius tenuissimus]|nr:hypothetical protein PM082_008967 [Marasmius tenuissimus]